MKKTSFTVLMCTYFRDDPYLLEKSIESVFINSIKPNYFILTIDGPIPKLNEKMGTEKRVVARVEPVRSISQATTGKSSRFVPRCQKG